MGIFSAMSNSAPSTQISSKIFLPHTIITMYLKTIKCNFKYVVCDLQVLGTDELNAYLNKYHLVIDPELDALLGR